jgi:hypothetical protein
MPLSANDYRRELHAMFNAAWAAGQPHIDVVAADLYAKAGGTSADKQMPNCCSVMTQEAKKKNATVLPGGPPSEQGPRLTIRYQLPR